MSANRDSKRPQLQVSNRTLPIHVNLLHLSYTRRVVFNTAVHQNIGLLLHDKSSLLQQDELRPGTVTHQVTCINEIAVILLCHDSDVLDHALVLVAQGTQPSDEITSSFLAVWNGKVMDPAYVAGVAGNAFEHDGAVVLLRELIADTMIELKGNWRHVMNVLVAAAHGHPIGILVSGDVIGFGDFDHGWHVEGVGGPENVILEFLGKREDARVNLGVGGAVAPNLESRVGDGSSHSGDRGVFDKGDIVAAA